MATVRFVHCADLHLDTPFRGLANVAPEVAAELNEATFKSYDNIVDLAIREQVNFVVIAGDVFNSKDRSLRAQFRFRDGLRRLSDSGIQSFVAFGNHDPLSGWSHTLEWPERTHRFGGKDVDICEVTRDGNVVATVHGISFEKEAVTEDLAAKFESPRNVVPSIAVLHSNVGGQTGHDNYAPTTVEELSAIGFDYWALGHVHAFRVLKQDGPAIVYPGCAQSRQPNETGAKGCCIVTLRDGTRPDIRFESTDTVRYQKGDVDISESASIDDVQKGVLQYCESLLELSEGRHVVARIALGGRTPMHKELARGAALSDLHREIRSDLLARQPWILVEKLVLDTRGVYDIERLRQQEDFVGDLVSVFDTLLSCADSDIEAVREEIEADFASWQGRRFLEALSPDEMRTLVEQAMQRTLDQFVTED
jgi:exonuclease SbcD